MVLHVVMVFELADDATAEELSALIISPIRVGIVAEEVSAHLGVKVSDELLSLVKLLHAVVVLGQAMCVLVEHSSVLHVLVV